ncbi:MAG: diacylglycerol kinase [Bacillota bacterium]
MKYRTLLESFNYAFEGIIYALKTQRNMRLHFVATIMVLVLSLLLQLTKLEILILFITIALVIIAEMLNTAIEIAVDLITKEYHPMAAAAKNAAAGAVLVAATLAVIVGYLIFFPKFDQRIPMVIISLQRTPAYLSLIAILLTIVLVIIGKSITKTGTPVQGGMPSGHSALSASAATTIFLIARNSLITFLALFLFFLVAESRIENQVHSWLEVLAGGLLGFWVTILIFQLLLR